MHQSDVNKKYDFHIENYFLQALKDYDYGADSHGFLDSTNQDSQCEPGWQYYNANCYLFVSQHTKFADAQENCYQNVRIQHNEYYCCCFKQGFSYSCTLVLLLLMAYLVGGNDVLKKSRQRD